MPWVFRREAHVWDGGKRVWPNFYPAATELHAWMKQAGQLTIFADRHRELPGAISNPYTYHLSAISTILGEVMNSCHDYGVNEGVGDPAREEIGRIRLYNELVLYFARFYEAAVKQLLFLTTFSPKRYRGLAIGRLLSLDCYSCRKAGTPHGISLLGSLVHPYKLCLEFEGCVYGTMRRINELRSTIAAHATAQVIATRSLEESRKQLNQDHYELGTSFLHSLGHIAKLEQAILYELSMGRLGAAPSSA